MYIHKNIKYCILLKIKIKLILLWQEHLEQDCILRDQMEGNWYNTYTSIKHSTAEKSLYMAFYTVDNKQTIPWIWIIEIFLKFQKSH